MALCATKSTSNATKLENKVL